jgi:hypothetical protein
MNSCYQLLKSTRKFHSFSILKSGLLEECIEEAQSFFPNTSDTSAALVLKLAQRFAESKIELLHLLEEKQDIKSMRKIISMEKEEHNHKIRILHLEHSIRILRERSGIHEKMFLSQLNFYLMESLGFRSEVNSKGIFEFFLKTAFYETRRTAEVNYPNICIALNKKCYRFISFFQYFSIIFNIF